VDVNDIKAAISHALRVALPYRIPWYGQGRVVDNSIRAVNSEAKISIRKRDLFNKEAVLTCEQ